MAITTLTMCLICAAGGQGKRTDLADACEVLKTTKSMKALALEHPTSFVKYHRGLRELLDTLNEPEMGDDADFRPRPWQQRLLNHLAQPSHDRRIYWVYDEAGGQGKSRLVNHLIDNKGATVLEGKIADMAYAYEREPIVCIDVTREQAEFSNHLYTFAEKLKNGTIFSQKFTSKRKRFTPPHVIFFSNSKPKETAWTADRLVLLDLSDPAMHTEVLAPVPNRGRGRFSNNGRRSPARVAAEESD